MQATSNLIAGVVGSSASDEVRPTARRLVAGGFAMTPSPPPKRHPYHQWAPDARALDIIGDKWTLLIVRDLSIGPRRFIDLHKVLPGISSEQLRLRLQRMVADGLLTRRRYREVPPRVEYELTPRSRQLMPVLGALAQWGYDWAWSAPRESEAIDIGAVLRLAPALVRPPQTTRGIVELTVECADAIASHYTLTVGRGEITTTEQPAPIADVRVSGTQANWVAALGPSDDRRGLRVRGDDSLATLMLDGLRGFPGDRVRGLSVDPG